MAEQRAVATRPSDPSLHSTKSSIHPLFNLKPSPFRIDSFIQYIPFSSRRRASTFIIALCLFLATKTR